MSLDGPSWMGGGNGPGSQTSAFCPRAGKVHKDSQAEQVALSGTWHHAASPPELPADTLLRSSLVPPPLQGTCERKMNQDGTVAPTTKS